MLAMYHRELLGDLSRLSYEIIKELMTEAANDDKARPGVDGAPFSFALVSFSGWPASLAATAVKDKTRILCIRGDSSFRFARE